MPKLRLLLADDHQLLVDCLRKMLEPEFELEAVADGRAALTAFERSRPDLLLLDIGLPLLNGIEVARQVKRISSDARILFVTMQTDRLYVEEAFQAGAAGYALKQAAASELTEAIRTVLSGHLFLSPQIALRVPNALPDSPGAPVPHIGGRLTRRQREVLQLIAEGKSMKEIAEILNISVRTVEFHKNGIMEELGLRSTAELTRYALDQGIAVSSPTP